MIFLDTRINNNLFSSISSFHTLSNFWYYILVEKKFLATKFSFIRDGTYHGDAIVCAIITNKIYTSVT